MQFALFFIPLFVVTTSGVGVRPNVVPIMKSKSKRPPISLLPLQAAWEGLGIRNPEAFLANMYDADPAEIKRMLQLADELIAAGVAEERRLSDAREYVQQLYTNQSELVEDCKQNLEGATSSLELYRTRMQHEASVEATNRRNMYEGEQDKNQQKLVLDKVTARNKNDLSFLNDEQTQYIELRALLVRMKNEEDNTNPSDIQIDMAKSQLASLETNRRLLQNTDEVTAEEAIEAVDELLRWIETKKKISSDALVTATARYNQAVTVHQDRIDKYERSKDNRDEAERLFAKVHDKYLVALHHNDDALKLKQIYFDDLQVKKQKTLEKVELFKLRQEELEEIKVLLNNV